MNKRATGLLALEIWRQALVLLQPVMKQLNHCLISMSTIMVLLAAVTSFI